MLKRLRLKLIYALLGEQLKNVTIRALVQGVDIWYDCTQDEAMHVHPDDIAVVKAVEVDIQRVSDFWTI